MIILCSLGFLAFAGDSLNVDSLYH